jgi:hypothetical protein
MDANPSADPPEPRVVPLTFDIRSRKEWLAPELRRFKPVVTIDGQPVPVPWGRSTIPVYNGEHEVSIRIGGSVLDGAFNTKAATIRVDTRTGPKTVYFTESTVAFAPDPISLSPVHGRPQTPTPVQAAQFGQIRRIWYVVGAGLMIFLVLCTVLMFWAARFTG